VLDVPHPAPDLTTAFAPALSAVPPSPAEAAGEGGSDLLDGLLSDGEDTLSLVLDGAVDTRLEAELVEILDSIRSSGVRHIVLEMATVTAMDAAGLRFLFAVRALADERSGTVRLADPADVVLELVAAAGLGGMLGLDTTVDGAGARPGPRPA
jgi:anti-anti-sigma factor